MNKSTEFSHPVFVPEPENQSIKRLDAMLTKAHPKLVGTDGEEIFLPDSAYQVLRQVIHMMAENRAIALVPYDHYLSSQEAADLLNVSRPHLKFLATNVRDTILLEQQKVRYRASTLDKERKSRG